MSATAIPETIEQRKTRYFTGALVFAMSQPYKGFEYLIAVVRGKTAIAVEQRFRGMMQPWAR